MEIKYLEVLIMDNGEILFLGKSLGFLKNEERKYLFDKIQIQKK